MRATLKLLLFMSIMGAPGCQCERSESTALAFPARSSPVLYSSDQATLDDTRDFFSRLFGENQYISKWSEMNQVLAGGVDPVRIPYYDTWYPEATGGTNQPGYFSLNKYDQAFHSGESKAAKWEQENHSHTAPDWFGHCNGTSVSVSRHQSPRQSVKRPKGCVVGSSGCVEFSPTDIRALLSEMNMNAYGQTLAGARCWNSKEVLAEKPELRIDPEVHDECDDVNPAAFHMVLVNFIGRMKQPIIFDKERADPVWNYPIYQFKTSWQGPLDETQALASLQYQNPPDSWVFNRRARSWFKVSTTVYYRSSGNAIDQYSGRVDIEAHQATYEYILEVDENGELAGGEWIGANRSEHPDFLWMPFQPLEPTGSAQNGNPHLSNKEVTAIWAESVGLDPVNPFRDKPKNQFDVRFYPPNDLSWGVVSGYYRLLLDGRTTGSLFLGKKSHLRIDVADLLKDANVEVQLNGKAIDTVSLANGQVDILFDATPGVNILTLVWASARVGGSELDKEFRFIAM